MDVTYSRAQLFRFRSYFISLADEVKYLQFLLVPLSAFQLGSVSCFLGYIKDDSVWDVHSVAIRAARSTDNEYCVRYFRVLVFFYFC
jgi:ABC-type antimicrobial peptide transport system permease subunit